MHKDIGVDEDISKLQAAKFARNEPHKRIICIQKKGLSF